MRGYHVYKDIWATSGDMTMQQWLDSTACVDVLDPCTQKTATENFPLELNFCPARHAEELSKICTGQKPGIHS